jgi:hypothetical protein
MVLYTLCDKYASPNFLQLKCSLPHENAAYPIETQVVSWNPIDSCESASSPFKMKLNNLSRANKVQPRENVICPVKMHVNILSLETYCVQ